MARLTHALRLQPANCRLLICIHCKIVIFCVLWKFLPVFLYFYGGTLKPKAKVIRTFLPHSLLWVSLAGCLNPFLHWSDNIFLQANSEARIQLPSFMVHYWGSDSFFVIILYILWFCCAAAVVPYWEFEYMFCLKVPAIRN